MKLLRDDAPQPVSWLNSITVFAEAMHKQFDYVTTSPGEVEGLVSSLEHTWSHPRSRPTEMPTTDNVCPTWWEIRAPVKHSSTVWFDARLTQCSLETKHASPHVNFTTGSVRLGHERRLQHIQLSTIQLHLQKNASVEWTFRGYHMFISAEWWNHLARTHDCHACYLCPREVW